MEQATLPRPVLPARIKNPRWHKGLLVAANVAVINDEPVFGKVNSDWVRMAMEKRLCQLCGMKVALREPCAFPGDPTEWEHVEAPLHIECARYSMLVCPRILSRRTSFTFSICSRYRVNYFAGEPDTITPIPPRKGSNLYLGLYLAHSDACSKRAYHYINRLDFDELLKWSSM